MDIVKIANVPLLDNAFAPRKCEWLPIVLAAAGLATSIAGGVSASNAAKKAERRQREQEAKEDAWYNRRYNEDYVDTAAGQNLVRRAKEYAKEQYRKAAGAQAVAGGSDAATQMAKDAGNKLVGDTIANIAAADTQRKSHVDDLHRQASSNFAQMDMNRELQRAQNIQSAASQAGNSLMSMAGAMSQTSMSNNNLMGGGNNSLSKSNSQIDADMGVKATVSSLPTSENAITKVNSNLDYHPTGSEWQDYRKKVGGF